VFDIDGSAVNYPGVAIQTSRSFRLSHITSTQFDWQPALVDGSYRLVSPLLPIFFGSPFALQVTMYASVFLETHPPGGSGGADIDFLHTAQIAGFQAFDTTGAPISDFTVTSASGTQYPLDASVPEPASLLLVLAGLAALTLRRPRSRSSNGPVVCFTTLDKRR
jgi:hypothetical protein